ncbi:MAG: SusE domain-containing protein [Flavobacteriaceae bacterium]|nr:SusE domain-containing protein [Flavobacteriaceae bacterium]MDZ4147361.1 SusE domain-containing protein [Flavobacteriaceae bacterium]
MKKILFLFSLIAVGFFTACDDEDRDPVAAITAVPELLSPTASTNIILTDLTAGNIAQTFIWTPADFGTATQVNYTVELDIANNNFATAVSLGTTTNTFLEVTGQQLNSKLLAMGLTPGEPASLDTRVVASISENFTTVPTETVTFTATPFTTEVTFQKLYVPGGYQDASGWGGNWSPDQAPTIVSAGNNDKYEGYIFFGVDDAQFKFTDAPDWNNGIFGDSSGGFAGTLSSPGDNMVTFTPGVYRVKADLVGLIWSVEPTNWGLIGSAIPVTGWDSDVDMTYDSSEHVLTITINLIAGEIKFRANDDWALNFGDNDTNGSLEEGGSNIPIAADGNYTIKLDLKDSSFYTYTVTKN